MLNKWKNNKINSKLTFYIYFKVFKDFEEKKLKIILNKEMLNIVKKKYLL